MAVASAAGLKAMEPDVAERISSRDFPSVFQAWNRAENLEGENMMVSESRHDLIFHGPGHFGLRWNRQPRGLASGFAEESIKRGRERRAELLRLNPNIVILGEIRYRHP